MEDTLFLPCNPRWLHRFYFNITFEEILIYAHLFFAGVYSHLKKEKVLLIK
jgi:hypothetical protein